MLWQVVLVIHQVCSSREDAVSWHRERLQDGLRDRPLDDHLLAMQGLGDLIGLFGEEVLQLQMVLKESAPLLLATFLKAAKKVQCRGVLSKEQRMGEEKGSRTAEFGWCKQIRAFPRKALPAHQVCAIVTVNYTPCGPDKAR